MMSGCEACDKAYLEVKALEKTVDMRYLEYKDTVTSYKVERAEQSGMLKAIHKRMDAYSTEQKRLNDNLIHHMKEEGIHHSEVKEHMARNNELLEHLATKEGLAKTNGRVTTMWIIGGTVVVALLAIAIYLVTYIKNDLEEDIKDTIKKKIETATDEINRHSTDASKANYYGLAKVVRKEVREAK